MEEEGGEVNLLDAAEMPLDSHEIGKYLCAWFNYDENIYCHYL